MLEFKAQITIHMQRLASCPGLIFFVGPVENWAWYTLFAHALIYPWNSTDLDIAIYVTVY